MRGPWVLLAGAATLAGLAPMARADADATADTADTAGAAPARMRAAPDTRLHWALGVGGYAALTGPGSAGPAVELELYPGGRFGRWGMRAAALGLDLEDPGAQMVTAGATYSAASARPHLHLALHADLGAVVGLDGGARAVAGGGLQSQLWVVGPAALGFDATAHAVLGDGRLALALAGATTLRVSY